MLGVFALVVMSSVLDGVMDKIATGFSGMSWDGTLMLAPRAPPTTEEQKRFAMSPGLRFEDLPRLTAPDAKVLAFLPRATKESAVKVAGGTERCWVNGVWPDYARWMNRPIAMGRGLTDNDERRRSTVAVVGATLAPSSSAAPTRSAATSRSRACASASSASRRRARSSTRSSGTTRTGSRSRSDLHGPDRPDHKLSTGGQAREEARHRPRSRP